MFAIPRGHIHCENNLVVDFVIRHCVSMCYILYIHLMLFGMFCIFAAAHSITKLQCTRKGIDGIC